MTAIPMKSIEGCLVENERLIDPRRNLTPFQIKYLEEVNMVIQRQGDVKITLNREKLARIMFYIHIGRIDPKRWEIESVIFKDYRRLEADAILNALPELVEVVK